MYEMPFKGKAVTLQNYTEWSKTLLTIEAKLLLKINEKMVTFIEYFEFHVALSCGAWGGVVVKAPRY